MMDSDENPSKNNTYLNIYRKELIKMKPLTNEQIKALTKEMRQTFGRSCRGKTEKEIDELILHAFFVSFCEDNISREDLTKLTKEMGYEVNDDVLDQVEKDKAVRRA